jgi:hypothetical protein
MSAMVSPGGAILIRVSAIAVLTGAIGIEAACAVLAHAKPRRQARIFSADAWLPSADDVHDFALPGR